MISFKRKTSGRPALSTGPTAGLARNGMRALAGVLALSLTASAGAGGPKGVAASATAKVKQWLQVGEASWYGRARQGARTASGERFDASGLTCAHRTLPFGSWLRVTNLKNSRSVMVRVTDRGPMSPTRIVDLSKAAADALGIDGIGQVRLETVQAVDPAISSVLLSGLRAPILAGLR